MNDYRDGSMNTLCYVLLFGCIYILVPTRLPFVSWRFETVAAGSEFFFPRGNVRDFKIVYYLHATSGRAVCFRPAFATVPTKILKIITFYRFLLDRTTRSVTAFDTFLYKLLQSDNSKRIDPER